MWPTRRAGVAPRTTPRTTGTTPRRWPARCAPIRVCCSPSGSAAYFPSATWKQVPEPLRLALAPLYKALAELNRQIAALDQQIARLSAERYPETSTLTSVPGIGQLTALTYVLTLGGRQRFAHSREAGAYLGLRPRQRQSGERDPSWASPRTATATCAACWRSAPTTCSAAAPTRPSSVGACRYPPAANAPGNGLWSPSPANSRPAASSVDHRRNLPRLPRPTGVDDHPVVTNEAKEVTQREEGRNPGDCATSLGRQGRP